MLNMVEMLSFFKQPNTDALLEAIGRSDINSRQLAGYLKIPELLMPQMVYTLLVQVVQQDTLLTIMLPRLLIR